MAVQQALEVMMVVMQKVTLLELPVPLAPALL